MNSVVCLESFKERFVSGLMFSMLEGLEDGQAIVFSSQSPLDEFQLQLQSANIDGIVCSDIKKVESTWQVTVSRKTEGHKHSCCGICGGLERSS